MASRSLGTLTLDLIAKIGGFVGPLDKASRESQKRMAEIKKSAEQVGIGIGAAVSAGVVALAALTVSSVRTGAEISKLSQVSGAGSTEFQKYAAGAKVVGIEQEKLADIFKDTNDKVGDFLSTGGGELKDFFENIAPKVGVTADQFRNLSGPQALQLFASSLEKANVSQSEMTFYMEAIANDATLLVPLLRNGGEGFKYLGEQAAAAGAIMDEKTIGSARELEAATWLVEQSAMGLKNQLVQALLPTLSNFAIQLSDTTINGVLANKVSDDLAASFQVLAKFAVATVGSVHLLATSLKGLSDLNDVSMGEGDWWEKFVPPARVYRAFQNFEEIKESLSSTGTQLDQMASGYSDLMASFDKPVDGAKAKNQVAELADLFAKLRQQTSRPGTFTALTEEQRAAGKAAETAAKKLQGIFDTTEQGYQREIELINTSNDARQNATEIAKLQFEIESGKLVGINGMQQKRLEGLAAELDSLKKIKQANEDAAKLADFSANVGESNQTAKDGFDQDLAGAGKGDKYRARLQEMLAIEQDFNRQQRELVLQRTSGDISQELYDQETEVLSEALAERLVLQQDYYNQLDEAQNNWLDGVSAAWENYRDTAVDYQQQAADFTASTLDTLTGSVGDGIASMILESESLGDAFGKVAETMAKSIINALAQMAAQWLVYQAVQLVAGKATQASAASTLIANAQATSFQAQIAAFASTAAIPIVGPVLAPAAAATAAGITAPMVAGVAASALAGMAHDGIDSVPETGTWLLQKGERVTTADTSAKLDRTLDRVSKGTKNNGQSAPVINLIEDARRAGQVNRRQLSEQDVIDIYVSNIRSEGDIHDVNQAKYGLKSQGA